MERWTDAVPAYPNGALVTPDGSALIVVERTPSGSFSVEIDPDGAAGDVSVIAELPDTDADGGARHRRVWVTLYRPDGLVRIASDGSVELVVDNDFAQTFDAPTNLHG